LQPIDDCFMYYLLIITELFLLTAWYVSQVFTWLCGKSFGSL